MLTGLGLVGMCAAAMLLSPVLARVLVNPLGRVVGRPFGVAGKLSRTNAIRNPRRTAATAFALTLGLVLVSGIAVIGASMKSSINAVFDTNVKADYILSTQAAVAVPAPAVEAAAKVPGVGSLTELYGLPATVDGKHATGMAVAGPLAAVMQLRGTTGATEPTGHVMLVSRTTAGKPGWGLGSEHVLTAPGRAPVTETVGGIYGDDPAARTDWVVCGEVLPGPGAARTMAATFVVLVKAAPGTRPVGAARRAGAGDERLLRRRCAEPHRSSRVRSPRRSTACSGCSTACWGWPSSSRSSASSTRWRCRWSSAAARSACCARSACSAARCAAPSTWNRC